MRKRLTSETLTPGSAYATDEQVQAALNIAQQTLGQDPSIHPTATVSEPIEGVAWAQEEQAVRGSIASPSKTNNIHLQREEDPDRLMNTAQLEKIKISRYTRTRTVFLNGQPVGHVWKKGGRWYNVRSKTAFYYTPETAARNLVSTLEVEQCQKDTKHQQPFPSPNFSSGSNT